jgi:hypothetical protein
MVADFTPADAWKTVNAYSANVVEDACPAEDLGGWDSVLRCAETLVESVPGFEDCAWESML